MSIDKNHILELLKQVEDPELHRSIVSLGMVQQIRVEGGEVAVYLSVTSGSENLKTALRKNVLDKLKTLQGVEKVQVEISTTGTQSRAAAESKNTPSSIDHIIAVASGKGGVGKTTVAVNLSLALAKLGHRIGLMDGDIYGPNVPLMLGVSGDERPFVNEDQKMIPLDAYGIKMISMGVLVPANQPMVWRGPMLHGAVTQLIQKVDWGELDYLIVDLPPGTGDVQLSLVQTVSLTGAIIVTTPQEVALMDVRKGIAMFQKTHVPILGVIENMTGEVFGSGGGGKTALEFQVPLLGQIPLDSRIRQGGDNGKPIVISVPDSPASQSFLKVAESLVETLSTAPPTDKN